MIPVSWSMGFPFGSFMQQEQLNRGDLLFSREKLRGEKMFDYDGIRTEGGEKSPSVGLEMLHSGQKRWPG